MGKNDIEYKNLFIEFALQLKKLVNVGDWGLEAEEIKLAGVRAEFGNTTLTYLRNDIQYKASGKVR